MDKIKPVVRGDVCVQLTICNTAILATAGWKWKMCRKEYKHAVVHQ